VPAGRSNCAAVVDARGRPQLTCVRREIRTGGTVYRNENMMHLLMSNSKN